MLLIGGDPAVPAVLGPDGGGLDLQHIIARRLNHGYETDHLSVCLFVPVSKIPIGIPKMDPMNHPNVTPDDFLFTVRHPISDPEIANITRNYPIFPVLPALHSAE